MTTPSDPASGGQIHPAALPLHIVLVEPEIPPNTGNIMRLCANHGAQLHLIEPLGFSLDDRLLRRAGLDYRERSRWQIHDNLTQFRQCIPAGRMLAFSTKGVRNLWSTRFRPGDCLLFGAETRGLSDTVLTQADQIIRLPMLPGSRSLNLSNTVAIASYEAWRQLHLLAEND